MSTNSKSYGTRVFSAFFRIFSITWKAMIWTGCAVSLVLLINSCLYACKLSCFSPVQVLNAMTWLTNPFMETLDQALPFISWWVRFCSAFWDTSVLVYALAVEAGCIGFLLGSVGFLVELLKL